MKSNLKIISIVSLILLLSAGLYGNDFRIKSFSIEQDTLNNKLRVDSFPLPIIAPSTGVQFFRNKVIFLSLTKNERKMTPNHISFGTVDAYYASILDSVTGKHVVFSPNFPFSFPCEAVTFNRSYDTIYFTKLAENGKEKIFMARYSDDGTTGITGGIMAMEFCTGQYDYSHPTLSADGNMMIFASDKDGSVGGMDLFISRRKGKVWSSPENLGNLINTAGNEFYPFLDHDNNLFFSSDGMKGSGGYDIFTCKYNGKGWDKPIILPTSINSKYDDIAFTINSIDGKSAFFTRRSGKNEMQLFRIKVRRETNNLLSIFNGNPAPKTLTAVVTNEEKSKPSEVEAAVTKPATKTATKPDKNTEKKPSALDKGTKKAPPKPAEVKELPVKPTDSKSVTTKPTLPVPDNQKDIIIYRVQISSSGKPKKEKEIVFNGKNYPLYEYFYLGAYRYCIGEFTSNQSAAELQKICRKSTYPDAFVAAFRNNTRLTDLKSIK
jgi:hypothetical protein